MRRSAWLWSVVGVALPFGMMAGCGDDGTTGGGGQGGDTTTTTTSTTSTTSSTSSSSSQGGGGSAPGNDTCAEPEVISVVAGDTKTAQGTTDGAADDYDEPCGDKDNTIDGADVVYEIQVEEECTATISATSSDADFDIALSVRLQSCGMHASTDYCLNNALAGGTESLLAALPQGTYYVVVDGADGSSGDFSLEVECAEPTCGDSVVNTGEECDDGNTMVGDGCDATCQYEPSAPDLDLCPDVETTTGISVSMGSPLYVPPMGFETTLGATDSGTGSCMGIADPPTPAPDHIYKVIPEANGTLTATIGLDQNDQDLCALIQDCDPAGGCVDRAIWARSADCDSGTEVACSDNPQDPAAVETIMFTVAAGMPYYIFVDGYDGAVDSCSSGSYVLKLELN